MNVDRWGRKRNEDVYKQSYMQLIVQLINKNKLRCREERGRVNAEGCDDVKDEGKETPRKTNTKVARQHREPPERKEHISERSPRNEMFWE